jgi:hypothetical protein
MTLSETQASRPPALFRTMPFGLVPLAPGFPPLPRSPSLHAVPTTPVDRIGAYRSSLWCAPAPGSSRFALAFPTHTTGRHPYLYVSRLAQASLALRPTVLLAHLTWTLSRGSSPDGFPSRPLVSYPGIPIPPGVGLSPTGDLRHKGARARHRNGHSVISFFCDSSPCV